MSVSRQEIIEAISDMSVLDLSELIKEMEDKFGVSASAPVAMVGAAVAGDAAVEEAEEQTEFTVVLTSAGDKKIGVIKVVRAAAGLGLKESKDLTENLPATVLEGIAKEEADKLKAEIEEAGGSAEVK